jgi:hypothetical protein
MVSCVAAFIDELSLCSLLITNTTKKLFAFGEREHSTEHKRIKPSAILSAFHMLQHNRYQSV